MASTETITNMLTRFTIVFDMKLTDMLIETWELALSEISDEVIQHATVHFIKTWGSNYNRKPRPGDVFEYQKELFEQQKQERQLAEAQKQLAIAAERERTHQEKVQAYREWLLNLSPEQREAHYKRQHEALELEKAKRKKLTEETREKLIESFNRGSKWALSKYIPKEQEGA